MSLPDFITIVKDSSFNISDIYQKAPNETLITLGIIVVLILIGYFFIDRSIKRKNALKLVETIQDLRSFDDFDKKIKLLVEELPRRGEEVATSLNSLKEHILFRAAKLIANLDINKKIDSYSSLSKSFENLAKGSKKYNNTELTKFFETKSKEVLEENLFLDIKYYCENTNYNTNELENINAIVSYANTLSNPEYILNIMKKELDRFSFGYNSDIYKLVESMEEEKSKQIYKYCKEKLDAIFEDGNFEVSINVLEYLIESKQNEKVYNYISTLKLSNYLQQLYNLFFDKKDDIHLDLAFIANPLQIENEYKKYIDESLTNNWRDKEHIEFVSKSKGVIEVLGHMEFRTLIERVDNITLNEENTKKIEEALTIAKRAESIALEAKSLNKRPLSSNIQNSINN
ncbi:hypothetical protein [Halarcobacter sp.]|uniref:hypothetical protein n=1 Tax=Halarcobacter sp. TaxID=2321133 RepID=UPI002AAAD0F9|nr:hypothetical protein [Halarcobacter sp.]